MPLQKRHFRNIVNALNGKYTPPSRTTFEDSFVASYAAAVRVAIINHLKESWDLRISFDGGKLGKKFFYSIPATTPNCQSFCFDLDDVTRARWQGLGNYPFIFQEAQKKINSQIYLVPSYSISYTEGIVQEY